MHENWWGWLAVIIIFVIVQAWRALFRSVKSADSGMARLNAAAERILKERQGAAAAAPANPLPRNKTMPLKSAATKAPRSQSATARPGALLPKSTTPAVIRRSGTLGAREPVIQRRR
jgi:hypothetical protein